MDDIAGGKGIEKFTFGWTVNSNNLSFNQKIDFIQTDNKKTENNFSDKIYYLNNKVGPQKSDCFLEKNQAF